MARREGALCPLCLNAVQDFYVYSGLAALAFGESRASVHEVCNEKSLERLRLLTPIVHKWPALLRAGRDLR
jgi:hypothetical protein